MCLCFHGEDENEISKHLSGEEKSQHDSPHGGVLNEGGRESLQKKLKPFQSSFSWRLLIPLTGEMVMACYVMGAEFQVKA